VSLELEPSVGPAPEVDDQEDVEHYIAVYTELLAGIRRLQRIAPEHRERLEREHQRLSARLAPWLERRAGGLAPRDRSTADV
jgi:hypothetical protein